MNFVGSRSKRLQECISEQWRMVGRRHAWAVQQMRFARWDFDRHSAMETQALYDKLTGRDKP